MGLLRKKPHKVAPARPGKPPKPVKARKQPKPPKPGKQPKPPKAAKPGKPPKPPKPGKTPKPPKAAKRGKAPKPPKPEKGLVRGVVDPADFIALRFEMVDLRARLEASEAQKAIVETRLAALDAGNAMARPREGDGRIDGEVRHRIAEFEAQLGAVAAAAAAASATAENAAAQATAAATAIANTPPPPPPPLAPVVVPAAPAEPDPAIVARLDALAAMVDAQTVAQSTVEVDHELGARVDELMSRMANVPDAARLHEIETLLGDLSAKIAEPPPAASTGSIESLVGQLAQLNARVTAQAEVGAQLSSLRDRIGELSNGAQAPLPPPVADETLSANVQALTYRVEVLAERMESAEGRARLTADQLTAIEHRMSEVSTELTNQVSELGRDIDGFGDRPGSNGSANGNGSNGSNGQGSNGQGSNGHGSNGHATVKVTAEMLAELQAAQVKLAAEQARYEIAFRQDLAALAEHVRRARA